MSRVGTSLGGCRLLEEIGRGGVGTVYRAERFGETVALKVLAEEWSRDPTVSARFVEEGNIMSRLSHPAIVKVFDVGQDCGLYFLILEFVEGPNFARCIQRRIFSQRESARLLASVGRAVQHAHRKGVIHSDIVPGNILVGAGGKVKLTDFGIARAREKQPDWEKAGVTAGTPVYMSPEQAAGLTDRIDERTDIYSLATVLYEAVTWRAPFSGRSTPEILQKVVEEAPRRPTEIRSQVDPKLEKIILKAMEKNPVQRYGTMKEFADELQAWARNAPDWNSMILP